jgi:hypothetical protein
MMGLVDIGCGMVLRYLCGGLGWRVVPGSFSLKRLEE